MTIAIIVHGGAKVITEDLIDDNKAGCQAALMAGWTILHHGGSALDAVEAAIRVLETDPTFNAGTGADLNTDGEVELDAAIMEGSSLRWGGVAAAQGLCHPISVARTILETQPMLLAARGAERFAAAHDAEMCDPSELIIEKQRLEWEKQTQQKRYDTVGCVALDASGHLAAGTSTGGTMYHPPGRVGDSCLLGCGLYANQVGACSNTGDGESITTVDLAKVAIDFLETGLSPEEAAQKSIEQFKQTVSGEAGCILLDRQGRVGWAHNSPDMACAYLTSEQQEPAVFTRKPGMTVPQEQPIEV